MSQTRRLNLRMMSKRLRQQRLLRQPKRRQIDDDVVVAVLTDLLCGHGCGIVDDIASEGHNGGHDGGHAIHDLYLLCRSRADLLDPGLASHEPRQMVIVRLAFLAVAVLSRIERMEMSADGKAGVQEEREPHAALIGHDAWVAAEELALERRRPQMARHS